MRPVTNKLSRRMQCAQTSAVRELLKHSKMPGMISLAGGIPAPDLFDLQGLQEAVDAELSQRDAATFQYGLTEGDPLLRSAIGDFMTRRGAKVDVANVLVTTGSQQVLDMIAKAFLDEGDSVLVERPTYLAALQVFQLAGAAIETVPGDRDGMDVEQLEARLASRSAKLLYVVPNFGNPTGATLSYERRIKLVELAARHDILLVEDDPYGQLRLGGQALPSLYDIAQDRDAGQAAVIHMSSFSKILAPGLRVGWCVAPPDCINYLAIAKQSVDLHASSLSQRIVYRYLTAGRLERRIEHLVESYRARRDALILALQEHLGEHLALNIPDGGMFLWGRLSGKVGAKVLLQYAIAEGVVFVPGEAFYADAPDTHTLRLSFATITSESASEAALRLKRAFDKACAASS